MACQLEGPIVDSLYDMLLISWCNKLEPPLPSANSPAAAGGISAFSDSSHDNQFTAKGALHGGSAILHPQMVPRQQAYGRPTNEPTGPTTTEQILHPVGGGGAGDLTPKQEPASTLGDPRQVRRPAGNVERGGDFRTGEHYRLS